MKAIAVNSRGGRHHLTRSQSNKSLFSLAHLRTLPHVIQRRLLRFKKNLASSKTRQYQFLTACITVLLIIAAVWSSTTTTTTTPSSQLSTGALPYHRRHRRRLQIGTGKSRTQPPRPKLFTPDDHEKYQFNHRQLDVRNVTAVTYQAYFDVCPGRDEFDPAQNTCNDWFNVGLMTLDSLDTLLLMRLDRIYNTARDWAAKDLSFHRMDKSVSGFELIIRVLAGLVSAFHLTNDAFWKDKAVELADLLMPSFALTKSGCLPPAIFVGTGQDGPPGGYALVDGKRVKGTVQLEMRSVSHISGDVKYATAGDKCITSMLSKVPSNRVIPTLFNVDAISYNVGSRETIGGSVDSFYEMLFKTWVASGKRTEDEYLKMAFTSGVSVILQHLLGKTSTGQYFLGERRAPDRRRADRNDLRNTMDHLSCFFPGLLTQAAHEGLGGGVNATGDDDYLPIARKLMHTCYLMSKNMRHGLVAEIVSMGKGEPETLPGQSTAFLRPEIVESLYFMDLLDPLAGDTYKTWGWNMWTRMRVAAQVPGKPVGVWGPKSGIDGPLSQMSPAGKLHSFVIAETLKYFFLLFDERERQKAPLSPDSWILNTEAHPVRRAKHE